MSIFENDDNEQYEGNPEVETNSPVEKKESNKIELEMKTHLYNNRNGLINVEKSQEMLNDLTFMTMKLEQVNHDLKSLENLSQIKEHVKNLQNITIDTNNFEKQFQTEIEKLTKKIESIVDNADLHELDEISEKIKGMNKTFKKHRYITLFIIAIFAFVGGYFSYYFYPIKLDESSEIQSQAAKKGVKFTNNLIAFPSKMKPRQSKNGKYIYYKIK